VPCELGWGRGVLERLELRSSLAYYSASGVWVALYADPVVRADGGDDPDRDAGHSTDIATRSRALIQLSYTANVAGAVLGTALPLLLIELMGFRGTLWVGAACNVAIAVARSHYPGIPETNLWLRVWNRRRN